MPDFRPQSDFGLSQDIGPAMGIMGTGGPLNQALKAVPQIPGAVQNAQNQSAIENAGGFRTSNPMMALYFQHLKDHSLLDKPVSDTVMDSEPVQRLGINRHSDGTNATLREIQESDAMAKYNKPTQTKPTFDAPGSPILDSNAKPIPGIVADGKGSWRALPGSKGDPTKQKSIQDAAAAFKAIDQGIQVGQQFLPDSSIGGYMQMPMEALRGKFDPQSPENKFKDQMLQAATQAAVAEGGRMSEEKVKAAFAALGGSGIGETKDTINQKGDMYKNTIAARSGVTRQDVEDYISGIESKGGRINTPTPAGAWQNDPRAQALLQKVKQGIITPAQAKMQYRVQTQSQ